jgi:hypothetical protein
MPLVSITRLRVRSFRFLPAFLLGSLRSAREAKNASGNLVPISHSGHAHYGPMSGRCARLCSRRRIAA